MRASSWSLIGVAGILAACGSTPASTNNDAGVTAPSDTGSASTCANHIPDPTNNVSDPQFGTLVGRSFGNVLHDGQADFSLPDCDGQQHNFYGGEYCTPEHTFTIVSIAAGWCQPCQYESSQFRQQIVDVYGPQGVRLIQILVQDPSGNAPNGAFCHQWVDTYGLSVRPDASGVGNYELMDLDGRISALFPSNALPSTIIVDSDGVIVYHEDGTNEALDSLRQELDLLLAQ